MTKEILLNKQGQAILKDGKVISVNSSPTPSVPTTLGSRIDDKATVVGVLQDHEGNDYVLAVVDAAYRSNSGMAWGQKGVDTPLQNSTNYEVSDKADHHTGKYNTDIILSTYEASNYPAFNFAINACSVTIGSNTYYSVLPSMNELNLIYENKDVLDQYDPTVIQYSSRSLSTFKCGGLFGLLSSNECNSEIACSLSPSGTRFNRVIKNESNLNGVCPVICIPLS